MFWCGGGFFFKYLNDFTLASSFFKLESTDNLSIPTFLGLNLFFELCVCKTYFRVLSFKSKKTSPCPGPFSPIDLRSISGFCFDLIHGPSGLNLLLNLPHNLGF